MNAVNDDDVQLVNWLLGRGLLANRLADDAELAAPVNRYREIEASLPFPRTCNSMDERGVVPVNYALHIRGDINRRGDRVPRGLPQFVAELQSLSPNLFNGKSEAAAGSETRQEFRRSGNSKSLGDFRYDDTNADASGLPLIEDASAADIPHSSRLELAEFLADPRHGLAARVYVNRVWQWVFGNGLVRTPNDFGHLAEQPSHPELLDYLTREFIADGWSTKRLIRRLVLSRTFRQSGEVSTEAAVADPSNRWLHHYPTRRSDCSPVRSTGTAGDRSILKVSIMDRSKFLQSFNAPDSKLPTGRRDETNVPAQALVMLNDPLVQTMANHWSSRLVADDCPSAGDRIRSMFVQALGRPPAAEELARWTTLLYNLSTGENVLMDREPWKHAAHTLFNLQEFTHYR